MPKTFVETLLWRIDKTLQNKPANELKKEERKLIVKSLKNFSLRYAGLEYKRAIVADGGVDIDEINFKDMQSKLTGGLFITGDMLNINRPSGGFSLQLCWTTAYVASKGILKFIKENPES